MDAVAYLVIRCSMFTKFIQAFVDFVEEQIRGHKIMRKVSRNINVNKKKRETGSFGAVCYFKLLLNILYC